MTPSAPQTATLDALCCQCGNTRTVSKRGTADRRQLRCTACKVTTTHAVIGSLSDDWREHINEVDNEVLRQLARDIAHMESLGIAVDYGEPQGGLADVRHYIETDDAEWRVILDERMPPGVHAKMLQWAWKTMLPSTVDDYDHSWGGEVCTDEHGQYRGCYYIRR